MYDVVIIGAGVVGGFVARQLSRCKLKIALVERHNDVCCEATKANTAIVHSGYSGKPGSIKAEMTRAANEDFDRVCEALDVKFLRCGSLIIASDEEGAEKVRKKYEQGLKNKVKGLALLSREEALTLEPNLNKEVIMAMYAPTCGVVNPWEFGLAGVENAVDNGVELFLNTTVLDIVKKEKRFLIKTDKAPFTAKYVVNCAGINSDNINNKVAPPFFRIAPRRGEYYVLDKLSQAVVNRVIFTSRGEDSEKGVIVAPTVHGNLLVGPSTEDIAGEYATCTTSAQLNSIKEVSRHSVVNIPFDKTIRTFAGIRPRPQMLTYNDETGAIDFVEDSVKDFILGEPAGCENFINCAGIKSPGLTCANEIGKYVLGIIEKKEGKRLIKKTNFNPCRKKLIRFAEQTPEEKARLVRENPNNGHIVCRCQQITEAEVLDAIHRTPGATTVDGVKRRVGAGLGRCQGGFCSIHIVKILARELGCDMAEILKDDPGSVFLKRG